MCTQVLAPTEHSPTVGSYHSFDYAQLAPPPGGAGWTVDAHERAAGMLWSPAWPKPNQSFSASQNILRGARGRLNPACITATGYHRGPLWTALDTATAAAAAPAGRAAPRRLLLSRYVVAFGSDAANEETSSEPSADERAELAVEQQLLDEHARSPRAFVPIPATRGTVRGRIAGALHHEPCNPYHQMDAGRYFTATAFVNAVRLFGSS